MTFLPATYAMKRQLTKILLLGSLLGFTIKAGADDRWETLRAINWVENPTNHTRMGRHGELGPYQFRPATWRMHTGKPFRHAIERAASDEVAVKHYEWIKRALEQAGVDATPFNIAMAWNSGVENVLKGRVPAVSYDYAARVTNLVKTFRKRAPAAVAQAAPVPVPVRVPTITLEAPLVGFAVTQADAPKFALVLPPEPEIPVVRTDRGPGAPLAAAATEHSFTFTTAATLTPRFSL
ncbi:MAG: hypothetical protein ACOZE5_09315 [Verrucomicrobiota bacterium]